MNVNPEDEFRPLRALPEDIEVDEAQPPLRLPQAKGLKELAKDMTIGKTVGVAFIVAVIVIIGLGVMGGGSFVLKKDFEANWANMEATVNTAKGDLEQLRNTVNNAVQGISSMVNSQVSTAINQATNSLTSQINELSNKFNTLSTDVGNIKSRLVALEEELVALEQQLEAVETEEAATVAGADTDTIEVHMGYSRSFVFPAGATTSGSKSIHFEVENTLEYDVKDINVELVIHSRGVPISLAHTPTKVSGGYPLQWDKVYVGDGVCVLHGITPTYGDGLEIDADDADSIYVTVELAVLAGGIPTEDVTFYAEGKVIDYEVGT